MPRSSDQSYQDFVRLAFDYFVGLGNPAKPNAASSVHNLYTQYSAYNPDPKVQAKVSLKDKALYNAMITFIDNAANKVVRVQGDDWSVLDNVGVRKEYVKRRDDKKFVLSTQAQRALRTYLHVYPAGATNQKSNKVTMPNGRPDPNNWRIGINVKPDSIAAALAVLAPIMDSTPDIHHIKFAAPGTAGKPDSVIIYMRKKDKTYTGIRTQVQAALGGLNLQSKFSPMWNEFANGVAEASEPPKNGGSFGTYRCILAYLAYYFLQLTNDDMTPEDYLGWCDAIFEIFGIPQFEPHQQGPLNDPLYDNSMRQLFMSASALYKRKPANSFKDVLLINR